MADTADDAIIRTPRLILRRFRESDFENWFTHMNTAEVRAHLGEVESREKCRERFDRQAASWNEETGGWVVIERREDGAFIGGCGFAPIDTEAAPPALRDAPEIGWSLRADCWGHGYATEAARGVLGLIFERFDHPVAYSQTSEANRKSWRVMERLGMERAEDLDYDDPAYPPEENPTKIYRLDREAWRSTAHFRLETDRLVLRSWRGDDFGDLHALCTSPEVMATIGPLHDEERTHALLARLGERHARDGCTFWAMERKDDGRVIGFCGAGRGTVPQLEKKLEIGWRMAFDCWGQGYAREAALATLGWLAENHPGEEVWAITARSNSRSQGLMKRLGMTYREGMDFDHPAVENGSPLKPHVTYWLEHP